MTHVRSPLDTLGPAKSPGTSHGKSHGIVLRISRGVNFCAEGDVAKEAAGNHSSKPGLMSRLGCIGAEVGSRKGAKDAKGMPYSLSRHKMIIGVQLIINSVNLDRWVARHES